jgi:hypothetical protein
MLWRNGCDGKVLRCGAGNRHQHTRRQGIPGWRMTWQNRSVVHSTHGKNHLPGQMTKNHGREGEEGGQWAHRGAREVCSLAGRALVSRSLGPKTILGTFPTWPPSWCVPSQDQTPFLCTCVTAPPPPPKVRAHKKLMGQCNCYGADSRSSARAPRPHRRVAVDAKPRN